MKKNQTPSYNNIFITGMPGTGKSEFARSYAYRYKKEFIDFDDFLEKHFKTKIHKIFSKYGVSGFRKRESQILPILIQKSNTIVALGGGTLLNPDNFKFLQKHGIIASLLDLPLEQLAQRIWQDENSSSKRKRPLFSNCKTYEEVYKKTLELNQKREDWYKTADIHLNQKYNSIDNLMLALRKVEKSITEKDQQKN